MDYFDFYNNKIPVKYLKDTFLGNLEFNWAD
jgi:hypothetical protein